MKTLKNCSKWTKRYVRFTTTRNAGAGPINEGGEAPQNFKRQLVDLVYIVQLQIYVKFNGITMTT